MKSDFDVFEECFGDESSKYDKYMKKLSPKQRKIVLLLMDDYELADVCKALNMPRKELNQHLASIRDYKKVSVLF